MSTRSLTIIKEEGETVCTMYRQMDGYPEGHGKELADFLGGMIIVNGLGFDEKDRVANGMGCLAAQVVAHFKDGPGSIYLCPEHKGWEEYAYTITGEVGGEPNIKCYAVYAKQVLYDGPASKFFPEED